MEFPLGIRFNPTDEEKMDLLLCKVTGVSVPSHNFIGTCDLYGDKEPWEIFGPSEESELYFFTTLKKVGKNKMKKTSCKYKRFSRNVGKGTWSNKGKTIPIHRKRKGGGGLIGYKKCLRYERKKGEEGDDRIGTWLLKEYSLPDNILTGLKEEYKDDCVLCVLKRKGQWPCEETRDNILSTTTKATTADDVYALWNDLGDIGDTDFLDMVENFDPGMDASWNDIGDDPYFFDVGDLCRLHGSCN